MVRAEYLRQKKRWPEKRRGKTGHPRLEDGLDGGRRIVEEPSSIQNHLFNPIKIWVLSGVMSTVLGLTRVFKFQPSLGKLYRLIVERNAVPSKHVKF